jgi:hypothetical protein
MSARRTAPSIGIELQSSTATRPSTTRQKMPTALSPFLPTPLELRLLLIYPTTLLLGSLFSTVAPHVRSSKSTYSASHQSFQPPHEAPSYFAQKRNVFNVYFVKVGWFWTTFALLLFIFTHPSFGRPFYPSVTIKRARAALRWGTATLIWTLTTQWFFGPPLIDRSFRLTGGSCELIRAEKAGEIPKMDAFKDIMTHAQCKVSGGTWSGGIDISGHVFLLILGSTLLWMEVLPAVLKSQGLREARAILLSDGTVAPAEPDATAEREKAETQVTSIGVKFIIGVVGLMWWMLLMTAAFFHTWSEKLSGLIVAFFGVWLVYFLPRGVPVVRSALGMPGI